MLKNYFKIAIRTILKNKWPSGIKIVGLSISIACCLLIFSYVYNELSHDAFHKNSNRIYRVLIEREYSNGDKSAKPLAKYELADILQKEYPTVEAVSAYRRSQWDIEAGGKKFREQFALVDSTFLSMFTFPLLVGNPKTVLTHPDQIVITEDFAKKYFDISDNQYEKIIGNTLTFAGYQMPYRISGVLKSIPKTSSLQFSCLIRANEKLNFTIRNDDYGFIMVFAQLKAGSSPRQLATNMQPIISTLYSDKIERLINGGYLKDAQSVRFQLQPLHDVYLSKDTSCGYHAAGDIVFLYILSGIGGIILLLASINFITLSLGYASRRTSEIGMRKTMGALKIEIVFQYLIEVMILIMIAITVGYFLATLFLPSFNQFTQQELTISFSNSRQLLTFIVALFMATVLFSGGIPAVALSRLHPIEIFRATSILGGRNRISSILVAIQFILSIGLICCLLIMSQQIHYLLSKDLGFRSDNVLVVRTPQNKQKILKMRLLQHPEITHVSAVDRAFTNGNSTYGFEDVDGKIMSVNMIKVDTDYLNTLDLQLIKGRNFSETVPTDYQNAAIVNETFVKNMGFNSIIGKTIQGIKYENLNPVVIGIVKDYHIDNLHEKIEPLMIYMMERQTTGPTSLLIRIASKDVQNVIAKIETDFKKITPDKDFEWSFLNENLIHQYESEKRWQRIITFSTLFAVLISCLGLIGLASIITMRRTKEIGIRKVVGASISSILSLITKEFTFWILLANIFAWPIAHYAMHKWLQNFAYRIDLKVWPFLLSGLMALIIALITVSCQAMKAATANPVDSLRYE